MDAPRPNGGSQAVSQDTLITIKVTVNTTTKKLKLPLRDLGATVLPAKLRHALDIKPEQRMVLERYSDSAAGYITLDAGNPQVFKTLIRAAKAKLKLRLKATVTPLDVPQIEEKVSVQPELADQVMQPVIVRPMVTYAEAHRLLNQVSPPLQNSTRDSTAVDQRSVGSGIFKFRDARASSQTLINDEAPVPLPFVTAQQPFGKSIVTQSSKPELVFRTREPVQPLETASIPTHAWSVYCNICDKAMANAHFHCSICDGGDYDLCEDCVSNGKVCPGDGHWLIKRFIRNGKVVNSSTERILPSKAKMASVPVKPEPEAQKEMPGAFNDETKTLAEESRFPTRTCNNCVVVLAEREFVTCTSCDDFDLCLKCHSDERHGHHPAHGFKPATEETVLPLAAETKLAPGRNVRHNAICDGCDKNIYGVRHKCLNCPDWDYCNNCVKAANTTHPRHRFAALYEPISDVVACPVRHFGIYCDGPLCKPKADQSYILGVRYKCTICHDTDFCASCEALPGNHHNRTHPLIKLKTPVRHMNIATVNEDVRGTVRSMGDRQTQTSTKSIATETISIPQANAATQVQTVAEIKPTEVKVTADAAQAAVLGAVESNKAQPISIPVKKFVHKATPASEIQATLLNAHFVNDSVPDGQVFEPETLFTQIWTLKNPGPYVWPAGCSVRYVGGDNMLNVDNSHPASVTAIADATESNVVGREVAVGEAIAFKITLKAPKRQGKSISYWRLKAADGTPFGHRLWCDIEVKKAEVEPLADTPLAALQRRALDLQHSVQRDRQESQLEQTRNKARLSQAVAQLKQNVANFDPLGLGPESAPRTRDFTPVPKPPFFNPTPIQLPSVRLQQAPSPGPSEQPPAYDSMNLAGRLASMREQQKQRREQMIAQLQAQREHLQAQGIKREDMPSWGQHMSNAAESTENKERRDALKQRVAHIKANILKTREERERLTERLSQEHAAEAEKTAAIKKTIDDETIQEMLEKINKAPVEAEAAEGDEEKLEGSQMVFPKLEKESPASSTYQSMTSHASKGKAAYVENEEGEVERSATPAAVPAVEPVPSVSSPTVEDEEDDFESLDGEIEVLSAMGDDESDDDGFVTDEEYDILDASDSETVASK